MPFPQLSFAPALLSLCLLFSAAPRQQCLQRFQAPRAEGSWVSRRQVTSSVQQPFSAQIWSCCCLLTVKTVIQTLSSSIFIWYCLFCGLSNIHITAPPQDYETQPQNLSSQPISLSTSSPPLHPAQDLFSSLNLTVLSLPSLPCQLLSCSSSQVLHQARSLALSSLCAPSPSPPGGIPIAGCKPQSTCPDHP